jgi:hypothetical protein
METARGCGKKPQTQEITSGHNWSVHRARENQSPRWDLAHADWRAGPGTRERRSGWTSKTPYEFECKSAHRFGNHESIDQTRSWSYGILTLSTQKRNCASPIEPGCILECTNDKSHRIHSIHNSDALGEVRFCLSGGETGRQRSARCSINAQSCSASTRRDSRPRDIRWSCYHHAIWCWLVMSMRRNTPIISGREGVQVFSSR